MSISDLVQSSGWKNFMAKLYGMGATVVIVGALFKINHWPGGTPVITLGLVVEALIFFFSSFEPLHEELDWTLVYPELAGMSDPDEIENFKENIYAPSDRPIEKIEDILQAAGVDSEALKKLGTGISQIGESALALADISGATAATQEFVTNLQTAATSVGSLHETYSSSVDSIKQSATQLSGAYFETADHIRKSGMEVATTYKDIASAIQSGHQNISQGNKQYEEQLTLLSKNLSDLNSVYSAQIKETNDQMKGSKEVYSGLHDMISNLKASVDETNKYKEEVSKLKENISSLNSFYGNMLNTMNINKKK
ncbi:MAG: gliding motility protein GldL [Bacteroidales bacterium]|nr:gliding motility protein GldL [Bacteroidales bacterium]MBN2817655.1 gliding motility protein GldL [Bacteroidales bacterium]